MVKNINIVNSDNIHCAADYTGEEGKGREGKEWKERGWRLEEREEVRGKEEGLYGIFSQ